MKKKLFIVALVLIFIFSCTSLYLNWEDLFPKKVEDNPEEEVVTMSSPDKDESGELLYKDITSEEVITILNKAKGNQEYTESSKTEKYYIFSGATTKCYYYFYLKDGNITETCLTESDEVTIQPE